MQKQPVKYLIIKDAEVSVQWKVRPIPSQFFNDQGWKNYEQELNQWLSEAVKVENVDWLLSFMVGKILIQHGGIPADDIVTAPSNLWFEVKESCDADCPRMNCHHPSHCKEMKKYKVALCSFVEKAEEKVSNETVNRQMYESLQSKVRELEATLVPFEKLANEVLNNSNMDKNQIVYAYNKATVTMQDLRNVLSVLSKARNQKVNSDE